MGLSLYGDPDALDQLAQRLRGRAEEVRRHADEHVRRAEAAHWVSTAAQRYRGQVVEDRRQAYRAAGELDDAAAVLHAHADKVRQAVVRIAWVERKVTGWFEREAQRWLDDPPWRTWPVTPFTLPPSGDVRWLDVGAAMSELGVL
jgi:hypothetical protein